MHLLNRISPVQRRQLGDALLWMLASSLAMLGVPLLLMPMGAPLPLLLGSQTLLGIGLLGIIGLQRQGPEPVLVRAHAVDWGRAAAAGIGAGAAGSSALALLWHASPAARANLEERAALLEPLLSAGTGAALLVLALLPAMCEELFYRGLLRRTLSAWSPVWRVGMISVIFSLAHFDLLSAVPLALAGVALGVLAEQTRGWTVPVAAHLALNAFGVLVWARLYPGEPPAPAHAASIGLAGILVVVASLGPARRLRP